MALKGITRIELTDVKTGQKEVIEKHNLVTNAIPDLLTLNPTGYLWNANYSFASNMLPICPNAIGGILLYENPLEENPDKYYATNSNHLIGYSSNDVNPGVDVKRGSMNQTESGPLEDHSGYRFVFDFATSQGNGTISALGLTSKYGGVAGYGSMADCKNMMKLLSNTDTSVPTSDYRIDAVATKYDSIVGMTNDLKYGIYAYVSGQNRIDVGRTKIFLNDIALAIPETPSKQAVSAPITLTTANFASRNIGTGGRRYYNFMDAGDGYIWGFEHANGDEGNSSGPAHLNWVKISKEDFSFTEGSFDVNTQLQALGAMASENASYTTDCKSRSIIHKGYLYCRNYAGTGVVKINLSNPTDVKELLHPDGSVAVPTLRSGYYSDTMFNVVGDVVYFGNGHIINDEIVPTTSNGISTSSYDPASAVPFGLKTGRPANVKIGPYQVQYIYRSGSVNRFVLLMTPYLATINNLEKPVQKTADKTMKITYIIREEPENTEL